MAYQSKFTGKEIDEKLSSIPQNLKDIIDSLYPSEVNDDFNNDFAI